jgi:hypothetical protein
MPYICVLEKINDYLFIYLNLETLFGPLHRSSPCIAELRCQAIQMEHDPYIAERTQKVVYIVRCLWRTAGILGRLWGPPTTPQFQDVGSLLAAF